MKCVLTSSFPKRISIKEQFNSQESSEEEFNTKTLSVESSVKVPKLFPLAIGNKNVLTRRIVTTVAWNNEKYSNILLQNKNVCLKEVHTKASKFLISSTMFILTSTMMDMFLIFRTPMI